MSLIILMGGLLMVSLSFIWVPSHQRYTSLNFYVPRVLNCIVLYEISFLQHYVQIHIYKLIETKIIEMQIKYTKQGYKYIIIIEDASAVFK